MRDCVGYLICAHILLVVTQTTCGYKVYPSFSEVKDHPYVKQLIQETKANSMLRDLYHVKRSNESPNDKPDSQESFQRDRSVKVAGNTATPSSADSVVDTQRDLTSGIDNVFSLFTKKVSNPVEKPNEQPVWNMANSLSSLNKLMDVLSGNVDPMIWQNQFTPTDKENINNLLLLTIAMEEATKRVKETLKSTDNKDIDMKLYHTITKVKEHISVPDATPKSTDEHDKADVWAIPDGEKSGNQQPKTIFQVPLIESHIKEEPMTKFTIHPKHQFLNLVDDTISKENITNIKRRLAQNSEVKPTLTSEETARRNYELENSTDRLNETGQFDSSFSDENSFSMESGQQGENDCETIEGVENGNSTNPNARGSCEYRDNSGDRLETNIKFINELKLRTNDLINLTETAQKSIKDLNLNMEPTSQTTIKFKDKTELAHSAVLFKELLNTIKNFFSQQTVGNENTETNFTSQTTENSRLSSEPIFLNIPSANAFKDHIQNIPHSEEIMTTTDYFRSFYEVSPQQTVSTDAEYQIHVTSELPGSAVDDSSLVVDRQEPILDVTPSTLEPDVNLPPKIIGGRHMDTHHGDDMFKSHFLSQYQIPRTVHRTYKQRHHYTEQPKPSSVSEIRKEVKEPSNAKKPAQDINSKILQQVLRMIKKLQTGFYTDLHPKVQTSVLHKLNRMVKFLQGKSETNTGTPAPNDQISNSNPYLQEDASIAVGQNTHPNFFETVFDENIQKNLLKREPQTYTPENKRLLQNRPQIQRRRIVPKKPVRTQIHTPVHSMETDSDEQWLISVLDQVEAEKTNHHLKEVSETDMQHRNVHAKKEARLEKLLNDLKLTLQLKKILESTQKEQEHTIPKYHQ